MIDKVIWITDDNFLAIGLASDIAKKYDNSYKYLLHDSSMATSGQKQTLACLKAIDADVSTVAYSIFWLAIESSSSVTLIIRSCRRGLVELPSGPVLSQMLRGTPSLQDVYF
jgi:hypothetical protein